MAAGEASGPAITTAGSPGSMCISKKASTATSSNTGMACKRRNKTARIGRAWGVAPGYLMPTFQKRGR